jgi:polyisoprenoid-binding protein YceI
MTDQLTARQGVRAVDGRELPEVGTWAIDQSHTSVEFVGRHLMVSKVRGRFEGVEGTVQIAERPEDSSVEVKIALDSVSTGDEKRDAHLRSADFFDVEKHPHMTFRSTKVEADGDDWKVTGDLTIKGETHPVVLDLEFAGVQTTPWNTTAAGFDATAELDREQWGINFNQVLESGGLLVGKKIKIEISAELNPA